MRGKSKRRHYPDVLALLKKVMRALVDPLAHAMPPWPLFPPLGGEDLGGVVGPELVVLVLAVSVLAVFALGDGFGAALEDEVGFAEDDGATLEGRVLQRFWFWLRLDLASSA